MNRPKKSRFNYGYYFVAPFVVGFLLFGLYPFTTPSP
jgi:hypothetical protein